MSREPLSDQEITANLADLPGWTVENDKLHKVFEFENFSEAFAWMARVALEAEKMDHHPDWCNYWNEVHVELITHSEEAITETDFKMASKMEALAPKS